MLTKTKPRIKQISPEIKIIYIYRYISLLITSFFYLIDNKGSTIKLKLLMITCLTISAIIYNYLYTLNLNKFMKRYIIILIIIEVIGNIVILIPTGGINSPYIWYSLNSILITTYFYNIYTSLIVLLLYQIITSIIFMKIFENKHINLFQILINNNLFLSFILITVIAQLLVNQAKNLNNKSKDLFKLNKQLVQSNESLKESMGQIMSLYQTVHSFINLSSKDKLIDSILCYTQEITGSSLIFLTFPSSEETWNIKTSKEFSREIKNIIIERIANEWNNIKNIDSPIELSLQDDNFMIIPLNSTTKSYGVLGIELINDRASINVNQIMDQLKFIASLSSMALERLDFEEVKQQILINQEQNRIANEIHDDVSQRLFALSCGIFSIIKENEGDITEEIKGELSNINDLLNTTIKQLRKIIYDMSWKKSGASALQMNIKKFISDMSKLYNINIVLHIEGDEELINSTIKNCIYRIICESTGNAARHSECDNIVVSLSIQQNCTRLNIYDNGYGFDLKNTITSKEAGMGIKNIYNLVYSLNGQIDINSVRGKGTSINIILPNNMVNKEQGAVI